MSITETRSDYPNGRFNVEFWRGDTYGTRCASITKQGEQEYLVTLGTAAHDWNGRRQFDVSPSSPSRALRTEAGARRAVARWMGA